MDREDMFIISIVFFFVGLAIPTYILLSIFAEGNVHLGEYFALLSLNESNRESKTILSDVARRFCNVYFATELNIIPSMRDRLDSICENISSYDTCVSLGFKNCTLSLDIHKNTLYQNYFEVGERTQ